MSLFFITKAGERMATPYREKIETMSSEVVDSNPYRYIIN